MTAPAAGLADALRRLAQDRDERAWAVVLIIGGDDMQRLARRITGDGSTADDAVQEALLLIRDHAGQFRGADDHAARGWIMRITASAALQLLRSAHRRRTHESQGAPPPDPHRATESGIEDAEIATLIREQLTELPEHHRLPLVLRYWSDLELPRIAVALGWPLGTVKTRLHRGTAELRDRLTRIGVTLSIGALVARLQAMEATSASSTLSANVSALLHHQGSASCTFPATARWSTGTLVAITVAVLMAAASVVLFAVPAWRPATATASEELSAVPASLPAAPPDISALRVAILGDLRREQDVAAIAARLRVVHDPQKAPGERLDAIEVATEVDLGVTLDRFTAIDALVDLARREGVQLFLRVKPRVAGAYAKAVCRETKMGQTDRYHPSEQISFCDPTYAAAVDGYFRAVAKRYASEPVVLGIGIGICPSGETQYPTEGTGFGDFSEVALADWKAWNAKAGRTVTGWPALPPAVVSDSRIASDGDYYRWALWRAQKLAELTTRMGAAIRAASPRLHVGTFSYLEAANPAGYVPGFANDDAHLTWYFGSISLDHGLYATRDQDRSRPVATPGKLVAAEFDLISAYTDATHLETYARYLWMMGGQPRAFLPTWWSAGKRGGWAEGFWTGYSDDLVRRMCAAVAENRDLRAASVADVAYVVPTISGMGAMATWGPWSPQEWRATHTDVVRHLQAIGANFDLIPEDALTAAKLARYRLVIIGSPALYPWVRKALQGASAQVLVLGWAGIVQAPDAVAGESTTSWFTGTPSWWPTGGSVVKRRATIHFTNEALVGTLAGSMHTGAQPGAIAYVRGLRGTALATDDEGQAVMAVGEFVPGRKLYHLGVPLMLRDTGRIIGDAEFRSLLTNVLHDAGCTAYGELGPLRLYENARWLLVENPNGTIGTVAKPSGEWSGELRIDLLKHPPVKNRLDARGRLTLTIPAGASVVIPLTP